MVAGDADILWSAGMCRGTGRARESQQLRDRQTEKDGNQKEDWRQLFLEAEPGQFLAWKGMLYMLAEATEMRGFFIRDDVLDSLANVSYARPRRRR